MKAMEPTVGGKWSLVTRNGISTELGLQGWDGLWTGRFSCLKQRAKLGPKRCGMRIASLQIGGWGGFGCHSSAPIQYLGTYERTW
jgi:hypothetical protein